MSWSWSKTCLVRPCKNSTAKTPEKRFVSLPRDIKMRMKWLQLAGRNPEEISKNSVLFICEDHFNVREDWANYLQLEMGLAKKVILKPGCVPSKFDCQESQSKRLGDASTLPVVCNKRPKIELINIKEDMQMTKPATSDTGEDVPLTSTKGNRLSMSNKSCMVPQCRNTSLKNPNKMFVPVPRMHLNKWMRLAGRDPYAISLKNVAKLMICEDHFNIQKDFKNAMMYKMGFAKNIFLRPGCLPSKFNCKMTNHDLPNTPKINDDCLIQTQTNELKPVRGNRVNPDNCTMNPEVVKEQFVKTEIHTGLIIKCESPATVQTYIAPLPGPTTINEDSLIHTHNSKLDPVTGKWMNPDNHTTNRECTSKVIKEELIETEINTELIIKCASPLTVQNYMAPLTSPTTINGESQIQAHNSELDPVTGKCINPDNHTTNPECASKVTKEELIETELNTELIIKCESPPTVQTYMAPLPGTTTFNDDTLIQTHISELNPVTGKWMNPGNRTMNPECTSKVIKEDLVEAEINTELVIKCESPATVQTYIAPLPGTTRIDDDSLIQAQTSESEPVIGKWMNPECASIVIKEEPVETEINTELIIKCESPPTVQTYVAPLPGTTTIHDDNLIQTSELEPLIGKWMNPENRTMNSEGACKVIKDEFVITEFTTELVIKCESPPIVQTKIIKSFHCKSCSKFHVVVNVALKEKVD